MIYRLLDFAFYSAISVGAVLVVGLWTHQAWADLRIEIIAFVVVIAFKTLVRPWMDDEERAAKERIEQRKSQFKRK